MESTNPIGSDDNDSDLTSRKFDNLFNHEIYRVNALDIYILQYFKKYKLK